MPFMLIIDIIVSIKEKVNSKTSNPVSDKAKHAKQVEGLHAKITGLLVEKE